MKKIFNYLLIATLLIGTAVSFSSCKDDDKENENSPVTTSNIIGTWKCSDNNGYTLLQLNSNGTLILTDVDYTYGTDTEYGTYTYSNGILTLFINDDIETVRIKWLNADSFQFQDEEDGDIWVRQ